VRPALDVESFGEEPRDWLLESGQIPDDLVEAWSGIADHALRGVRECFERAGRFEPIRLHGDCHSGNVLWTDAGPHFVDLDDARSGPAIQDLWMLLPGDAAVAAKNLNALLAGYEQFHEFRRSEIALIEGLRTLRLLHYSAWIARRWDDPAFPAAFPWFGTQRYWQDRILELREQVAAMQESPWS
jgi:Ser/Thr protein kinase RdoA (MazF antagonist)